MIKFFGYIEDVITEHPLLSFFVIITSLIIATSLVVSAIFGEVFLTIVKIFLASLLICVLVLFLAFLIAGFMMYVYEHLI